MLLIHQNLLWDLQQERKETHITVTKIKLGEGRSQSPKMKIIFRENKILIIYRFKCRSERSTAAGTTSVHDANVLG